MLTVNEENFNQWIGALRDPANQQARNALCVIQPDGSRAYCCLGLGSVLVPGIEIKQRNFTDTVTFDGMTNLAPYAFIEWLGILVTEHFNDVDERDLRRREYDIVPDWPEGLLQQGSEHYAKHGGTYLPPLDLSAAGMNDCGFTFDQIADVFEHLGVGNIIS